MTSYRATQPIPIRPNATNTDSQPNSLIRVGVMSRPTMLPTCRPAKARDTAPERSAAGTPRATISTMEVGATASPDPTKARDRHSVGKVAAAKGRMAVPSENTPTPRGRMFRPLNLDESCPPGICISKKPQKKDDCIKPATLGLQPKSSAIGMIAMLMFTLSILLHMKAKHEANVSWWWAGTLSHFSVKKVEADVDATGLEGGKNSASSAPGSSRDFSREGDGGEEDADADALAVFSGE